MGNRRQSCRKGMEKKREAERSNSSRGYRGCYLTRRNRTDAKRVYGFCGCHKRAVALLCTSTVYSPSEARTGAPECRPPALAFCVLLYAVRSPFWRVQVKSYCPPIDHSRKALKYQGRFASKALHISPIFAAGVSRPFLRS